MKVSIALATYNGERWLREQLDSLAQQTLLPYELVVSDDQSTDHTLDVIRQFSVSAPFPVRVVDNDRRRGFADNFIHALRSCTGDAVAYCDQDDVWNPVKLERCAAAMQADPKVTLVHHDAEDVGSDLVPLGATIRPSSSPDRTRPHGLSLVRIPFLLGCCMLLHRKTVEAILSYWPDDYRRYPNLLAGHGMLGHDLATSHIASALGSVAYLSEPLIRHRQHEHHTLPPNLRAAKPSRELEFAGRGTSLLKFAELQAAMAAMYEDMGSRAGAVGDAVVAAYLRRIAFRASRLGRLSASRAELYSAKSRGRRLAQFSKMVRAGVYTVAGGPLSFGRCALKDLTFALAGPRVPQLLEAVRQRFRLNFCPQELAR
jgi:rhamnosyltransferase